MLLQERLPSFTRALPCRGANTGRFGNFGVFPVFCRVFGPVNDINLIKTLGKCWRGQETIWQLFSFSGVSQTIVKHSTWGQCPQVLAGKARKVAKSTRLCSYTALPSKQWEPVDHLQGSLGSSGPETPKKPGKTSGPGPAASLEKVSKGWGLKPAKSKRGRRGRKGTGQKMS